VQTRFWQLWPTKQESWVVQDLSIEGEEQTFLIQAEPAMRHLLLSLQSSPGYLRPVETKGAAQAVL